jgi:hypothetical protein
MDVHGTRRSPGKCPPMNSDLPQKGPAPIRKTGRKQERLRLLIRLRPRLPMAIPIYCEPEPFVARVVGWHVHGKVGRGYSSVRA